MRVAVACDHAGYIYKTVALAALTALGHEALDLGTYSSEPVDYPDVARTLGLAIQGQQAERGVLLCGSGVGAAIAACKMRGIRAAVCHDTYSAHQGVEHDDMNVLTLGARVIGPELVRELVQTFVAARYSGEERHARRLAKLELLEAEQAGAG